MANLPILLSRSQCIGQLVSGFLSRQPDVNDLSRQSVLFQLFTAIGQSQFKASNTVIAVLDATSVDRASGTTLQNIANSENVPIFSATASYGLVNITDTSFTKIFTTVYAGQPAPVAGSLTLYVANASAFTATTGSIYVGRGTANSEGPLQYSSITPVAGGAYYAINLRPTTPTTNFHNIGETVILAQGGNRLIQSGSSVQTALGQSVTSVQFTTSSTVTILDGETTITGVPVLCTQVGTIGNVSAGAISQALGLPFPATATNPNPFTTGLEADTDDTLRARIKLARASLARGTATAIQYYSQDVVAADVNKKVQSAAVVQYADNSAALVYSDGSGINEPDFSGQGFEFVLGQALGGELQLQLRNWPVSQAFVVSTNSAPYNIAAFSDIAVAVAGVTTIHQFLASDFQVPTAATAFEVVSSINQDANINFSARTANGGTQVVLYPKDQSVNSIQVQAVPASTGVDANSIIGFPMILYYTLWLYRNNVLLYQDGVKASIPTLPFGNWSNSITAGDTLEYLVDNTTLVTATFTTAAFQAVSQSATASYLTPIAVWAQVMSNLMPGVTAAVENDLIVMTSNLGADSRAALQITGGSLRDKIFSPVAVLVAAGVTSDYTLNKYTGQIGLASPAKPNDSYTAGSQLTRGNATSASIPAGSAVAGNLWMIVDGDAQYIPNGLEANTNVTFSKAGNTLTITATTPALVPQGFDDVQPGDWLLVWSNPTDPAQLIANSGYWRVQTVQVGQITVNDGPITRTGLNSAFIPTINRLVFVRTLAPMQQASFGIDSLTQLQEQLQGDLVGVQVDVVGGSIRISTLSDDPTNGQIFFVAADVGASIFQFALLTAFDSVTSQFGFAQNPDDGEAEMPSFTFGVIGSALSGSSFTQPNYLDLGGTGHDFVEILNEINLGPNPPVQLPDSNKGQRAFVADFQTASSELDLVPPSFMLNPMSPPPTGSPILAGDRFFLRTSYQFDSTDTATVVVDNNPITKSYTMEVARRVGINAHSAATVTDFSADDLENQLALAATTSFYDFNFANFKAWRQSNIILSNGIYAIQFKNVAFGPTGDKVRVGFVYPSSISETSLSYTTNLSDAIDIGIVLPVETVRTPNWSAQTSFIVSVVTTGAIDAVTYTWKAGPQPNFIAAGVVAGDIAFINANSSLLPQDSGLTGIVTSVTATSFTIQIPTGTAVSDDVAVSNIVNQNGTITVTTALPNGVETGSIVGLWNTAISMGSTEPLNGAYTPTVISPTQFTVPTPSGVPGGAISSISSVNGVVTVVVPNHGLSVNNIILVSGVTIAGLNGLYPVAVVLSANSFQYYVPGSLGSATSGGRVDFQSIVPGSNSVAITSITGVGGVVTVNLTAAPIVPLAVGQLVQISGTDVVAWVSNGSYGVGDVVKYGSNYYVALVASAPLTTTGNVSNITTPNQITGLASTTNVAAGWSVTDTDGYIPPLTTVLSIISPSVVQISANATGAATGDSITFTPPNPAVNTSAWQLTSISFNGIWVVNTVGSTTQFTYLLAETGYMVGVPSQGNAAQTVVQGNLARGIGGSSISYLQFAQVTTTAQEVADFVTQSMATIITAQVLAGGSSPIAVSTADINNQSGYFVGSVTSLSTHNNSRMINILVGANIPAGSEITLSGMSPSAYDGTYVVLLSSPSGASYSLTLWSEVVESAPSLTTAQTGNYSGSTPYLMMRDGERAIASSNLQALIGSPQFTLQTAWTTIPSVGEEVRLLACNNDQLQRFWSELVVSGLTNVSRVDAAKYGYELEVTTETPGSIGSIQFTGGNANVGYLAAVGSSAQLGITPSFPNGKLGVVYVPYGLQQSVTADQWLLLDNTVLNNKVIGLTSATTILMTGDGIQITGGPGSFQTKFATTSNATTILKVERHGAFFAFIGIAGAPLGLAAAGVTEGSWVRIINPTLTPWSNTVAYTTGQRASYNGLNYTVIGVAGPYLNVEPDTNPTVWQLQQINAANQGIFPVVRTFLDPASGAEAFWVEGADLVEEIAIMGDANTLQFYSYDSVMPGDTLVVSTTIFGSTNIGRYVVRDSTSNPIYAFPTATQIYTDPIPNPPLGPVVLGTNANQVNVQEGKYLRLWKHAYAVGAGPAGLAAIMVNTPDLINRTGSSSATEITLQCKLNFPEIINLGINAYEYYIGLIAELTRVIYGDPTSSINYPGVKAAGTTIGVTPSLIQRIYIDLAIRVLANTPSTQDLINNVQAAVAGYINTLPVGTPVSLSEVISVAQAVSGVVSVAISYPTYSATSDQIPVSAQQTPFIVNPTTDVTVSIIGG